MSRLERIEERLDALEEKVEADSSELSEADSFDDLMDEVADYSGTSREEMEAAYEDFKSASENEEEVDVIGESDDETIEVSKKALDGIRTLLRDYSSLHRRRYGEKESWAEVWAEVISQRLRPEENDVKVLETEEEITEHIIANSQATRAEIERLEDELLPLKIKNE